PDIATRVAIICVVSVFLCLGAVAQEGYYGVGHDRWHMKFYMTLKRNDSGGSCCNLMDCRPTQSRMVGDHYEVKVDGEWTPVPNDKINNADPRLNEAPRVHHAARRRGGVVAHGARHFGAAEQNFGAESQVLHRRRSD